MKLSRLGIVVLTAAVLLGCGWGVSGDGSLAISISSLPEGISSITVTVTGADMDTVTATFTGEPQAIAVPGGTNRRYTVIVKVDNDTPVTQYTATGSFDVEAGVVANVTARLYVSGSALIVPDFWNGRIVQADDASGGNAAESVGFRLYGPMDAEIGPDGLIYVLDSGDGTFLYALSSVSQDPETDPYTLLDDSLLEAGTALAIDQINRIVYYATWDTIYAQPLGGGDVTEYVPDFGEYPELWPGISGLTVDHSGHVYIAYSPDGFEQAVAKFDPAASGGEGAVTDTYVVTEDGDGYAVWDVLWKARRLYIAHNSGHALIELSDALVFVRSYGSAYDYSGEMDPDVGEFLGPARFVGHGNPTLTVIDDDEVNGYDRIVGLSRRLDGSSWTTSNAVETGTAYSFYSAFVPQ